MKVDLIEIKDALSKATPGPWVRGADAVDSPTGWVCQLYEGEEDQTVEFMNQAANTYLIAHSPEWLASLVEQVEVYSKHAVDFEEMYKAEHREKNQLKRQVEEMQKTQSQIIAMVTAFNPILAEAILQSLKGETT